MRNIRTRASGFSLMDMLTAMAVMSLMVLALTQIINHTTSITTADRSQMDEDEQARAVFERIANDLAGMPKRRDVDFLFYKTGNESAGNDKLFFFSQVPGVSVAGGSNQGPMSLVGYRIFTSGSSTVPVARLERMGLGLAWHPPGNMVYLTSTHSGSYAPIEDSTLAGNTTWKQAIGSAANNYDDGDSSDYTPLSDAAFRFEFCYLLKNGTWSEIPVYSPAGVKSNLTAITAPTVDSDANQGYSSGSRWFDTAARRAYICVSVNSGAAVWQPLGLEDVSGITVAIAFLDQNSRKSNAANVTLDQLIGQFADAAHCGLTDNPPMLMAQAWQEALQKPDFYVKAGISRIAASRIRIYQRYFDFAAP